jgi:membrane protein required for colicin V production
VAIDLATVALLALGAAFGSASGALHQLVQLAGMVVGWVAAWHLGAPVARGITRWIPQGTARGAAGLLLFLGFSILGAWVGHRFLATRGLKGVVRSPPDRGLGALLGGAKAALVLWVALSALALAGGRVALGRFVLDGRGSDLVALAREQNLLSRWRPAADEALERFGGPMPGERAPERAPEAPSPPVPKGAPHAR